MIRAEWDALSAREKDAVVAEKVMGALWWRSSSTGRRALFMEKPPEWFTERADGTEDRVGDWNHYGGFASYTTSWDAMREVVEKMSGDGFAWSIYDYVPGDRGAFFHAPDSGPVTHATAPTEPEAVCIAALTALGHMEPA